MPMLDSETPRSLLMTPSSPTGISSVVMAKNVASPSTAMPTTDWVVTVIGRVFVDTAEVVVVLVDTLLTSSGARWSTRRCRRHDDGDRTDPIGEACSLLWWVDDPVDDVGTTPRRARTTSVARAPDVMEAP